MTRSELRYFQPFLPCLIVALAAGCGSIGLPSWGGRGYAIDLSKVGTGEQAVVLRNDPMYSDGAHMDLRTRP